MSCKIFISYAREDHDMAKRLYADLLGMDFEPWMDSEDLRPGERWRARIREEIRNSDFFLALMSTNSLNKIGFVQKEVRQGLEMLEEFPDQQIYLIPEG